MTPDDAYDKTTNAALKLIVAHWEEDEAKLKYTTGRDSGYGYFSCPACGANVMTADASTSPVVRTDSCAGIKHKTDCLLERARGTFVGTQRRNIVGMSTRAIGIRPMDDKHRKMLAAYRGCVEAGIDVPAEVCDYFGDEGDPMEDETIGLHVDLQHDVAKEWQGESQAGIEIELTKLPKGVASVRFVNSW